VLRPVDKVLERAENARKAGDGWLVSCPVSGHGKGRVDEHPSVSVTEGDDGRALVRCKVGCETETLISASLS
jgi:putative DNA primase/helicase